MRTTRRRSFIGLWVIVILAQLAGDAALFLTGRATGEALPGLGLSLSNLSSDSLHQAASRYLRDSLGINTSRRNDTLLLTVPPGARRAIDAALANAGETAHDASLWLAAAVALLHLPLLLAVK